MNKKKKKEIRELIDRIRFEPSVLFMGQKGLSSLSGKDPFLFYASQKLGKPLPEYRSLWELSDTLDETICSELNNISGSIVPQWWLRKILDMR